MVLQQTAQRFYIFISDRILVPTVMPEAGLFLEPYPLEVKILEDSFLCNNTVGDIEIHIGSLKHDALLPAFLEAIPVRMLLSHAPFADPLEAGLLLRAFHIYNWRNKARYCGSCGGLNNIDTEELAMRCSGCGEIQFPRISPAVIVAVTDPEDRLLLAHNVKFKDGIYSLVAGFVEAGECFEDTLHRELKEETGVEIFDIEYVASQPWPFPDSLMVGFRAKSRGEQIIPDGKEIDKAAWFSRTALPPIPMRGSLSRTLIDQWLYQDF